MTTSYNIHGPGYLYIIYIYTHTCTYLHISTLYFQHLYFFSFVRLQRTSSIFLKTHTKPARRSNPKTAPTSLRNRSPAIFCSSTARPRLLSGEFCRFRRPPEPELVRFEIRSNVPSKSSVLPNLVGLGPGQVGLGGFAPIRPDVRFHAPQASNSHITQKH